MTLDTLYYVVRRLANQTMVRYYMDAKGDGSADTFAVEVYEYGTGAPARLLKEMEEQGFTFVGETVIGNLHDTGVPGAIPFVRLRWEAPRP